MIHPGLSVVDYQQFYEQYPLYQSAYDFAIYPQYHYTPSPINSELNEDLNRRNKSRKIKNKQPKELLPKTKDQVEKPIGSKEEINQQIIQPQYQTVDLSQGPLLPKLQSHLTTEGHISNSKQQIKSIKLTKKQKQENINKGHWSALEHTTYVNFLSQYENIMNSSLMKKTSKIFKQMSELIGTRTPSQCRSHHQKFNPYALRGDYGKRLPRSQRSRAGRKKKLLLNNTLQSNQFMDSDLYNFMYDKQNYYNPFIIDYQLNEQENYIINQNQLIQTQIEFEDFLKLRQDYQNYLEY
ncbi:unnamed protein product (macronuclear) [Paramecium tetraurelia]|uniref:Myb-like domain-containing protein n=1 Tax=Paramecium tetraurelia TaxID=5888 RepID=A0D5R1_PARTE|nr:uncharacterized protein GSPATT00013808001 [Paramecium tetraurelia]CAK78378.1 unnamed protein product [Paramecium tetraurelia]|eukprot:XP_001445775.1 hypothetical protein (macronuclear) [Paramecium tetraurelia strain d4-2]